MNYLKKYDITFIRDDICFSFNIKERGEKKSFGSITIHDREHYKNNSIIIPDDLKSCITRENNLYVSDFEIKKEYRGRKVGKYMFCFAISTILNFNKYKKVYLHPTGDDNGKRNKKLIKYYKDHLGFDEVKDKDYLVATVNKIKVFIRDNYLCVEQYLWHQTIKYNL